MALKVNSLYLHGFKGWSQCTKTHSYILNFKQSKIYENTRLKVSCAMNTTAGDSVSSLSEMSYCAHKKMLFLIPFPLLVGFAFAGVLREMALELSPLLKEAEVPWHLIVIAILFTLLKLPGPHYPYWGRFFIPHFANGGLVRILWLAFLWYRRPRKSSRP